MQQQMDMFMSGCSHYAGWMKWGCKDKKKTSVIIVADLLKNKYAKSVVRLGKTKTKANYLHDTA